MNETLEPLWRLEELAEQCQVLGQRLGLQAGESRRVSWEPSPRLLRYYTTLGLLDRATRMVGRTAYYCRRHLLQLLSIKHLQQKGKTLHEVQAELMGKADAELMALLELESDFEWAASSPREEVEPEARSRRFWEETVLPEIAPPATVTPHRQLLEFNLGPGLTLTIDHDLYPNLDPGFLELGPLAEALEKIFEQQKIEWRKP